MIISEYAIERQLVNSFIKYTFTNAMSIEGKTTRLFIWGYEILLPDGKGQYNSGILDLFGTDEDGEVWLIEAKLISNKEWNSEIWNEQLGLYAKSLQKRTEQEIVLGARRYIMKESAGTFFLDFIPNNTKSLSEAFQHWALLLGHGHDKGKDLYESTLSKIKSGNFIQCVLSDSFGYEIWTNRPKFDEVSRAYITFQNESAHVTIEKNASSNLKGENDSWSHETWKSFMKQKNEIKPTPDKIPLLLADSVIPTYEKILSNMNQIGWNGKYASNQKAFRFDLPTKYDADIRIHIGWIDADGQQDIQFRTPYQFGLKFNIDFRHFKKHPDINVWEKGYQLAKELAETARYNIRGREFAILDPYWTAEKVWKLKWDGEMYRFISQTNRDYIGLEEEQADLESSFEFLRKVVVC
ncbi:hypothetical protein QWY14_07845 [Planococcus sp. N028]|uniref:PD-(D/E)XK nuclease superfamily protein n=1 Tax=Planococcus shixiaomingii TaxID=3058393 RepID=A0ABT8N209_9BACL|nr:hypothetical protein [Planococcus sp. N028]MDN7241702.1 hypothetical protein [Planococcus sp. N028]